MIPLRKPYDLNDLDADMGNRRHLIETVQDHLREEVDFTDAAGERRRGMDRLDALMHIATEMVARIDERMTVHFDAIGSTCAIQKGGI